MKTLDEYEEWFQDDRDSMTGEDMFYYCYLEGCSIWYEDDNGEIVRFINIGPLNILEFGSTLFMGSIFLTQLKRGTESILNMKPWKKCLMGRICLTGKR